MVYSVGGSVASSAARTSWPADAAKLLERQDGFAERLAAEWVYWKTGNVNLIDRRVTASFGPLPPTPM